MDDVLSCEWSTSKYIVLADDLQLESREGKKKGLKNSGYDKNGAFALEIVNGRYYHWTVLQSHMLSNSRRFFDFVPVACSAGVLLGRADVMSSRSFIPPAMFDLELEWTVGVDSKYPKY